MRIDAHQHFWHYEPVRYPWIDDAMKKIQRDFLPEDLIPVLQRNNIDGTVAVQADQSEEETEVLLKLAKEHEFIKGVVGWVDLTAENVEARLEYFSGDELLKGLRHTVFDKEGEFMASPDFRKGISKLFDFRLTYDLLVFDYQLEAAIDLVRAFPLQIFVLDHLGKPVITAKGPSEKWCRDIEALGKCNNVSCKISGLVTQVPGFAWKEENIFPFLEVVWNAFGEDRLLFGSDWPVCLAAASYEDTSSLIYQFFSSFGQEVTQKIFGRNAIQFYDL